MTRSAVRSRLAPPRFALRATRGAATQEPEGRSVVPGEALLGEDGLKTSPDIIHLRATRGAATQEPKGEAWCPAKPSWAKTGFQTAISPPYFPCLLYTSPS